MIVRGRTLFLRRHALEGMNAERPPVRLDDIEAVLEEPERDDGNQATRWIRDRTIIVYYREEESHLLVRSVSCTRRRL